MKIKKIPYYLAQWLLMAGASLTMGLLSFSGILAICTSVSTASWAFMLTVAYEGEIYLQNIIGSFKKLFKSNQLERQLAKTCLREHCFPEEPEKNRPQFFKDYEQQLHLLHRFEDKRLDKASRERKRRVEKTLGDMEKWFAKQLFSENEGSTTYQKELRAWLTKLDTNTKTSLLAEFQAKRNMRYGIYQALKVFCVIAGTFMGLGTTYLLVEAFSIIPFLAVLPAAALPALIVPMAVIAGMAYGFLVYNAMTDMIASEMATTWFRKIRDDLANPKKWLSGVGKICVLSVMFLVTLALSICTAGTWWTVAKTTRPLFSWMTKIPSFIMLGLNPLVLSISTWAFNVENVSETLTMAEPYIDGWLGDDSTNATEEVQVPDEKCSGTWLGAVKIRRKTPGEDEQKRIVASKDIVFVQNATHIELWYCDNKGQCKQTMVNNPNMVSLIKGYTPPRNITSTTHLNEIKKHVLSIGISTELFLQKWNPFRMLINMVFDPLRKLLFLGHLMSIGATADQVPGVAPIIPAVLGAVSEGVEDIHYFKLGQDTASHQHKHDTQSLVNERLGSDSGHDHGSDLPSKFLTVLFSPFYFLAACWDFMFSPVTDKFSSLKAFATAFGKSWNKETGTPDEETVDFTGDYTCSDIKCDKPPSAHAVEAPKQEYAGLCAPNKNAPNKNAANKKKKLKPKQPEQAWPQPEQAWPFEQAAFRIERHKEKCLQGAWVSPEIAEQQMKKLDNLTELLHQNSDLALEGGQTQVKALINVNEPVYNKHRFFIYEPSGKTETREFLEKLSDRVAMAG